MNVIFSSVRPLAQNIFRWGSADKYIRLNLGVLGTNKFQNYCLVWRDREGRRERKRRKGRERETERNTVTERERES